MTADIVPFKPSPAGAEPPVEEALQDTVKSLLDTVEEMDRGVKLMVGVIAGQTEPAQEIGGLSGGLLWRD